MSDEINKEAPAQETPEVKETAETTEVETRDAHYQEQIDSMQEIQKGLERDKSDLQVALKQEREQTRANKVSKAEEPKFDQEQLRSLIREESEKAMSGIRVDVAAQVFDEELDKIATSEKEKELIKMNYRERIRPTGVDRSSIKKDLLLSKAAANSDRIRFEESVDNSGLTTSMATSGGRADLKADAKQYTDEEQKLFKGLGVDPIKK